MSLKPTFEDIIYNLNDKIISFGSYERDGSFPYVYNNEQAAIVMQDLDSDFKESNNNNILAYKTVKYRGQQYIVPLIKNQIRYLELDKIAKANNAKLSFINVLEEYKQITSTMDKNGMLLLGYKYDQDPDNTYKFKTIGVRSFIGIKDQQYGIYLWAEALQYDQDDDGNTTIKSLDTTDKTFTAYNYSTANGTMLTTFEYNSDSNKFIIEYATVEKKSDGSRVIDFVWNLNTDSDHADFSPDAITEVITMPELNQSIYYSYYHIKTFGDKLDLTVLDYQSNILITL